MKPIQKFLCIFFCLAILITPNIGFYAQKQPHKKECCSSKEKKCHKNSHNQENKGCNKQCDMHQHCYHCFTFLSHHRYQNPSHIEIKNLSEHKFFYKIPYELSIFSSIWQPPKIV